MTGVLAEAAVRRRGRIPQVVRRALMMWLVRWD